MEIKILNVNVKETEKNLTEIGAEKVFDEVRVISYFAKSGEDKRPYLKLTQEGEKLKLTSQNHETNREIKLFVSREKECVEMLSSLGCQKITHVEARRISCELNEIDFDVDVFPGISPFLELDIADNQDFSIDGLIEKLGLSENVKGEMPTPDIFEKAGKDYFELYRT